MFTFYKNCFPKTFEDYGLCLYKINVLIKRRKIYNKFLNWFLLGQKWFNESKITELKTISDMRAMKSTLTNLEKQTGKYHIK